MIWWFSVSSLALLLFSGESGLGKSTLINSLFLTDLYPERVIPGAAGESFKTEEVTSGVQISKHIQIGKCIKWSDEHPWPDVLHRRTDLVLVFWVSPDISFKCALVIQRRLSARFRSRPQLWRSRSVEWSCVSLWSTRLDTVMPSTARTGEDYFDGHYKC